MPNIDLAVVLADGEFLKREGDELVGAIASEGAGGTIDAADLSETLLLITLDWTDTPTSPGIWLRRPET